MASADTRDEPTGFAVTQGPGPMASGGVRSDRPGFAIP